MTGQLLLLGGSFVGVLLLVLASHLLGLGRDARIAGEGEARELADNALTGFKASEIALDADGRGALLRDAEGRILLLAPRGAHFAARLLDRAARLTLEGNRLITASSDTTFRPAALELGETAGAWAARIDALDS